MGRASRCVTTEALHGRHPWNPVLPRVLAVAAVLCVSLVGSPAQAHPDHLTAARSSALSGRIPEGQGPWAKRFPGTVFAMRLVPAQDQAAAVAGKNRRFRLSVQPGVYGVVTSHWKGKRAVPVAHLVRVKRGKTARLRGAGLTGSEALVSVGEVRGPGGIDLTSIMQTEMVEQAGAAPCDFSIVLDRKDPRYQELLKELRLQTTPYFPEKTRREAQQALRNQAALAPQYRVEGDITRAGGSYSGAAAGTFRLVQAATGTVLFERPISFSDAGTDALFKAAARDLSKAMCGIPTGFTGTVQADIVADQTGQRWQWNGTVAFVLQDGGEQPDGSFAVNYTLERASIGSARYTLPPSDGCSETVAEWSGSPPVSNGTLTLTVHADDSRSYHLAVGAVTATATASVTCDKQTVTYPVTMGLGAQSDSAEAWLGPTLAETYGGGWLPSGFAGIDPFRMNASWVLQPVGLE